MNVNEYRKSSLLDVMTDLAKLDYLSSLKYMTREQSQNLSLKLRDIPAGEMPLRDWNAAINYLSQGPPADEVETAKARLIAALQDPDDREN